MIQTAMADRTTDVWALPDQTAGGADRTAPPDQTGPAPAWSGPLPQTGPADQTVGPDQQTAGRRAAAAPAVADEPVRSGAEKADRTTAEQTDTDDDPAAEKVPWPMRLATIALDGTLTVVTTFLAATGQVAFGVWSGIVDDRRFLIPGITELFALAFLVKGYLRARANKSPLLYWVISASFGVFAVYTNLAHGDPAIMAAADPSSLDLIGGADASGMIFGVASAACQVLWFVGAYEAYQKYRRRVGRSRKGRAKFGDLWFTDTRLTFRAWRVSGRMQIDDVEKCLGIADQWIMLFERFRTATLTRQVVKKGVKAEREVAVGSLLARRSAWREVLIANGAPLLPIPQTAGLAIIGQVQSVALSQHTAPPPPAGGQTGPADQTGPTSANGQTGDQTGLQTGLQTTSRTGKHARVPSPRPRTAALGAPDAPDQTDEAAADQTERPTGAGTVTRISDQLAKDKATARAILATVEHFTDGVTYTAWADVRVAITAGRLMNKVIAKARVGGKARYYRIMDKAEELHPLPADPVAA